MPRTGMAWVTLALALHACAPTDSQVSAVPAEKADTLRLGGRITGLEEGIAPWISLTSKVADGRERALGEEPRVHRSTQSRTFSWKVPPGAYEIRVSASTEEGERRLASIGYEHEGDVRDLEIDVGTATVWVELAPEDLFRDEQRGRFQLIAENGHRPPPQEWWVPVKDRKEIRPWNDGQVARAHRYEGLRYAVENLSAGRWTLEVQSPGTAPFHTVIDTNELASDVVIRARLPRLPGRLVQDGCAPDDRHHVYTRQVGTTSWELLVWSDGNVISDGPNTGVFEAYRSPGEYELRWSSERHGESSWGPIVIEDDPEPLWLVPPEER